MIRRVAILATASITAACIGPREPDPCPAATECPVIDEEATSDDVRVVWPADEQLVMTLGDVPTDIRVVGGDAVFTPDPADPDCLENCAITLKRLRMELDDVYIASAEDAVSVARLELAFGAPSVLENPGGSASILPVDTPTRTCASVQGILAVSRLGLVDEGRIVARAVNEELMVDVHVPIHIDASTAMGCRQFQLELSGSLTGATPFDQNPLRSAAP
jgi:hypothetical protein